MREKISIKTFPKFIVKPSSLLLIFGIVFFLITFFGVEIIPKTQNITPDKIYRVSADKTEIDLEPRCVSIQTDLDKIIEESSQIFILNPAKTAGTSMKAFTDKCIGNQFPYQNGHIINHIEQRDHRKSALMDSFTPPNLITSHIWKEDGFLNLMRQVSKGTLLIYSFRSETERQLATMRQIISGALCNGVYAFFGRPHRSDYQSIYQIDNDGLCIVDESRMIQLFSERRAEMNCGIYKTLTCKTYEAMNEIQPRIIFVNYKQAGSLQTAISKKFCPHLLNKEFKLYQAKSIPDQETVFVRLNRTTYRENNQVPLKLWLEAKKHLLEWSLDLKHDASCTGKTDHLESQLLSCPNQMLELKLPYSI